MLEDYLNRIEERINRFAERINRLEKMIVYSNNDLELNETILALEYLRKTNTKNKYKNVFQDEVYESWTLIPDLVINGLIYDETENIFYIVESNKKEESLEKFSQFIRMEKPKSSLNNGKDGRIWNFFFDEESGIVIGNKENTSVCLFTTDVMVL